MLDEGNARFFQAEGLPIRSHEVQSHVPCPGPSCSICEAFARRARLGRIWDILKEYCGASDYMRDNFIQVALEWDYERLPLEYRFQGALGFGGKVWIQREGASYVNCYPEDEKPARRWMMKKANRALAHESTKR